MFTKTRAVQPRPGVRDPKVAETQFLDASGPGSNGGVSAAVRKEHGQGIGRPRLAVNSHHDAAPRDQRLEDPAVMGLKTDPAHRAGKAYFREIACASLQRLCHRSMQDGGSDAGDLETASRRAERLLDQRRRLRRLLRNNRQGCRRKTRLNQRSNPLARPRDVLKHTDREPPSLDIDHGRVMYHGLHGVPGAKVPRCRAPTCHSAGCWFQADEDDRR
jgi:hypothetical protein